MHPLPLLVGQFSHMDRLSHRTPDGRIGRHPTSNRLRPPSRRTYAARALASELATNCNALQKTMFAARKGSGPDWSRADTLARSVDPIGTGGASGSVCDVEARPVLVPAGVLRLQAEAEPVSDVK